MAFTGDRLSAREALECGLVSRVVADADLMDEARALAARIAVNPPHALRMTKRLLMHGRDSRLAEHLEMAASFQALAHSTADQREAVAAFNEKRKPNFTGA